MVSTARSLPEEAVPGGEAGSREEAEPLARLVGVTKRFGDIVANDDVTLPIHPGRILGLLGENGAGKTTAMNVLAGLYLPDAGHVELHGSRMSLGSPRAAIDAGVGMVHQHFRLVPSLTVEENLSLALDRGTFRRRRSLDPAVDAFATRLGFALRPAARVWQLPLAEQQQLEIVRVLAGGARVLILDEPTAVLSPVETGQLFDRLRRVAADSHAVVLISHKLDEVLAAADEVAVLRAGRLVAREPAAGLDRTGLAELMIGRQEPRPPVARATPGAVVLRVERVTVRGDRGVTAVHDASFSVRAGEVVGLVGVAGNGQSELLDALAGLRRIAAGTVHVDAGDKAGKGIAYVPEERLGVGLAGGLALADNAILGRHRRPPFGRFLRRRDVEAVTARVLGRFGVRASSRLITSRLSGGNLQRVVLARELDGSPAVVIAAYPTRGLDVGAAAEVRAALLGMALAGAGVLVASEELDELRAMCDRLLVLYGGRIVADGATSELAPATVANLMTRGVPTGAAT